jgi:ATP-dependent helicase/nuclease subunit A
MGEWVRYKLDQVTEHVLIDEAQDTNPQQWAIVSAIVDEFFAGEGTRAEGVRTLFTVGDYKQAIFGFQGTDPIFFRAAFERFLAMSRIRADYEVRCGRAGIAVADPQLPLDPAGARVRRCGDRGAARAGHGRPSDVEPHASEVPGPGTVTLWPLTIEGGSEAEEEEWVRDATREHAKRIARAIKGWLDQGLMLESKGRPLAPEDVMILVKRRGELASLIVARLYAEGVPVAGVDRLRLNAPLAVQDLLAAIRFALQPEDDLSLASLLVSPLIGWSQEELMAAAVREHGGLWRHLRATARMSGWRRWTNCCNRADLSTPYRFLEEILSGPMHGRRKLLLRLGEEARDPIEELLNAALNFEQCGDAFAAAIPRLVRSRRCRDRPRCCPARRGGAGDDCARREGPAGAPGDPRRCHGGSDAEPARPAALGARGSRKGDKFPIFRPRSAEQAGPLEAIVREQAERELQEHWRLFYVAATRAEERLVVTGALGPMAKGEPPRASWYAACARGVRCAGRVGAMSGEFARARHAAGAAGAAVAGRSRITADPIAALPDMGFARPAARGSPAAAAAGAVVAGRRQWSPIRRPTPALRARPSAGGCCTRCSSDCPRVAPDGAPTAAERWLAGAGRCRGCEAARRACPGRAGGDRRSAVLPLFGPIRSPRRRSRRWWRRRGRLRHRRPAGGAARSACASSISRPGAGRRGRSRISRLSPAPDGGLFRRAGGDLPRAAVEAALLYAAGPTLHLLPPDLLDRAQAGLGRPGAKLGFARLSRRLAVHRLHSQHVSGDVSPWPPRLPPTPASTPMSSRPTSPCSSISGPSGAGRAA